MHIHWITAKFETCAKASPGSCPPAQCHYICTTRKCVGLLRRQCAMHDVLAKVITTNNACCVEIHISHKELSVFVPKKCVLFVVCFGAVLGRRLFIACLTESWLMHIRYLKQVGAIFKYQDHIS